MSCVKFFCVDSFCEVGVLTHGFVLENIPEIAGIHLDPACTFLYEANSQAKFIEWDLSKVESRRVDQLLGDADIKILAGCEL